MRNKNKLPYQPQTAGSVPARSQQNLPSTEVRQPIPEWDEEIDLRDYLEVLIRRKWLIMSVLAIVFLSTLIFTLASPKIYRASGSLEVAKEGAKVTKFQEVMSNEIQERNFYETQVQLLKSDALAQNVIDKLNLTQHPVVIRSVFNSGEDGLLATLKKRLKTIFARPDEKHPGAQSITQEAIERQKMLKFMHENLSVDKNRRSMIIGVTFMSRDRNLSQDVVNTYMDEFIRWKMNQKLKSSELAKSFLMKQIDRAKINLEHAEEQLNRFAEKMGIVSLDSKLNGIYRQLEELNGSLAEAESDFIRKKSVYEQAVKEDPANLPQVLSNESIGRLKTEYAELLSKYEELSTTFQDAYPSVKALKSKMQSIKKRIRAEEHKVFLSISNEYQAAYKRLQTLKDLVVRQKQLALDLNQRATQYKIMAREVETNKSIYQSLLERAKEIESMVGVSASNIHIVDRAELPILPYKPKVMLNLLLAIVIGLMGGVGSAFVIEYFTDTISNPDEISDRFQIPILGVIPIATTNGDVLEMAVARNPRAAFSEAMRTTKVSIQLSGTESRAKSILISSASPSEGKTTIAVNLALAFASSGENVLLVDTDLRKPRVHKIFNTPGGSSSAGLSSLLAGMAEGKKIVHKTDFKNLHYVPAGPIPPNPVELLASNTFSSFMELSQNRFDRVILDGPPHHGFADILVLCQNVGGVVLVSSIGDTTRQALRLFKKGVLNVHGTILGCVINKVNLQKRYGYRSYYKYYQAYNYDYGKEQPKAISR